MSLIAGQKYGSLSRDMVTCISSAVQSRLSYLLGLQGYYLGVVICETTSAAAQAARLGLSFVLGLLSLCSSALLFRQHGVLCDVCSMFLFPFCLQFLRASYFKTR